MDRQECLSYVRLSLDANDLFDLSDDLNQIFLILHYRFDRFVGTGNFIQDAYVFTTFNARSLTRQIIFCEGSLRRATGTSCDRRRENRS